MHTVTDPTDQTDTGQTDPDQTEHDQPWQSGSGAVPPPPRPGPAASGRRLYRSTRDAKLGGVCAGIAELYGWDVITVRLVVALSILLPGPQVIAYLIAWVLVPTDRTVFGWA